ncbi:MAG: thiolase family protein [Deltaproteobacteria bacterium]|nr:thiolase family protein [Deltaproteobacteria bacterium]
MSARVGIVGWAQTTYEIKPHQRVQEMVYEVVKKVREQTGLKFTEDGTGIDNAITASDDIWDARTISDAPIGDVVGAHHRCEEKVAQDGAQAVFYACAGILSGHYDVTLVVSHCKESQPGSRNLVTHLAFDPFFQRPLGIDYLSAVALQARAYMDRYGISPEQCARVVVKSYRNAKGNPFIPKRREIGMNEVMRSPVIADPIRQLDVYPVTDGACALILAREEKARKLTDRSVWIVGMGNAYDAYFLGDRELWDCQSLSVASQKAYRMAGIKDPRKEIDVAEVSAFYSYQELLWTEGLGLCARGEGGKFLEGGMTEIDGKIPVNPSGGVLVGCPTVVAGMARVIEAAIQIRREGGNCQVPRVQRALAHGTSGPCGQLHTVLILSE